MFAAEAGIVAAPFKSFFNFVRCIASSFTTPTSTCMENFNDTDFFKTHKIEVTYSQTPVSSGPRVIEYETFTTAPQTEPQVDVCSCTIPTDGSADEIAKSICVNNKINLVREIGAQNAFYVLQEGSNGNLKFATFQATAPYIPPPAQPTAVPSPAEPTAIPPPVPVGSAQAN